MTSSVQQARHSKPFEIGAKIGLVTYGVVHLLLAWIALQVAWGGSGQSASQTGALATMADDTVGTVILWLTGIGLIALTLWQVSDAIWGFGDLDQPKRGFKKTTAVGRAILYAVLAFTAFRYATGAAGGSSGSGKTEETATAKLMNAPGGPWLVAAVGVGILAVGIYQIYKGLSGSFTKELDGAATAGSGGTLVERLGQVGYTSKGIALGIIGVLFGIAAATHDPKKAGGLDDALRTLKEQPFGPYLLTAVAVGIAAFGVYCFFWAKHVKHREK
ncbi:uncharacterized protein DUF1206 [Mumia flava]|uniref:Uncharacterized protein DUF1206 n=1 Tax=Mumia flava TaxID=1348852 RepID=A0A0B2B7S9_9ACTN|nr:DUF1206 domain-containing protein [Mumia flava]PJJ56802.1 uncharacterized protein DUF1206 [Mumia flava]